MPTRANRSRSLRKVRKRSPTGRPITHYVKKRPNVPSCADCGKHLHGVATGLTSEVKKLNKSEKRPDRPYGGNLCSRCSRVEIKRKLR
jgi:large subunit ribosomal protein L34e